MTESTQIQIERFLTTCRDRVEHHLDQYLPSEDTLPKKLHEAMRYIALNGGKRVRPLLTYTTGVSLNAPLEYLDNAAAAVELIHCYSLVHDDLPAMDDAADRRGKPSCHKAFDEATAILAGDALQCLAFELLASNSIIPEPNWQLEMLKTLAHASGAAGMVAGQAIDLENQSFDQADLEKLHRLKTGALIRASVRLGALAAGASDTVLVMLDTFANQLGLAFQIQDDILDLTGDPNKLGKPTQQDLHKSSYPNVIGLEASQNKVNTLAQQAQQTLSQLDFDTGLLIALSKELMQRDY